MAGSDEPQRERITKPILRWLGRNKSAVSLSLAMGIVSAYAIAMFVVPILRPGSNWAYVQSVWDRWQGLNVGVLALAASVVALRASGHQDKERNRRDFIAARAFLSTALSELAAYCEVSSRYLTQLSSPLPPSALSRPVEEPVFPTDVYSAFEKCIRTGPTREAEYITTLISELQVHQSRLRGFTKNNASGIATFRKPEDAYLAALVLIRARVDVLLPWARGEQDSIDASIDEEAVRTAFHLLGLIPEKNQKAFKLSLLLAQSASRF